MSFNPQALDHFMNPRNVGTLDHPTAVGTEGTPGQGNYMVIHILVVNERIVKIRYKTYGCGAAIASGSAITELAQGKSLAEAARITRDDVDALLGGLPLGRGHCADLAVNALQDAIRKAAQAGGPS